MNTLIEPERVIKIKENVDICIIGGSCTGVFAAVRAARLGAKVAIIERQNSFGGMACAGMVNIWHSIYDTEEREQIIGGLTVEVMESLRQRGAVEVIRNNPSYYYRFNSEELKIELDRLIISNNIIPFLNTHCCNAISNDGHLDAVIIENKSGRQAIRAKVFIDASGDGDIAAHVGIPFRESVQPQPPTMCCKIEFTPPEVKFNLNQLIAEHGAEFNLKPDTGWSGVIPDSSYTRFFAGTHIFGTIATDGDSLTYAEIEGRRQVRACMDMIKQYYPEYKLSLTALAPALGLRESRHFESQHCLTEMEVLSGKSFPDTIANGSYRVDVHNPENGGFEFKYLDGSSVRCSNGKQTRGRWREEQMENPRFYQIPFRSMINKRVDNLIFAGRCIDADTGAFGAIRVMVTTNQTGEAAGVAASLAADTNNKVNQLDYKLLHKKLCEGGSILF